MLICVHTPQVESTPTVADDAVANRTVKSAADPNIDPHTRREASAKVSMTASREFFLDRTPRR